jgi:hyperosmotically inducible protein
MIIEPRRLAQTLLLAAGLCGCASQHQRSETAADESESQTQRADDSETVPTTAAVADDADRDEVEVRDTHAAGTAPVAARADAQNDTAPNTTLDSERTTAADNTGVNERDRGNQTLTPGDQGNSESDLEITRRIRETVVDDDALSFTAKNVKIITVDGRVTLRGPVRNQAERTNIEKKALAVAGAGQVVNQLEIK